MWDAGTNSLEEVAQALAAGPPSPEPDLQIDIPLDEDTRLCPSWGPDGGLTLTIHKRSRGLSETQIDARREELLRLGARKRWSHSCWGSVDPEFGEALCAVVTRPADTEHLRTLLLEILTQLGSCGSGAQSMPDVPAQVPGAGDLAEGGTPCIRIWP